MLHSEKKKKGFTLLELAISLAVLGLLLVALFQLSAAGTQQISDQLTAQQMQGYLRAAKSFLSAKRKDAPGTRIYFADDAACTDVEGFVAVGGARDITNAVRCFRPNTLPLVAANDNAYKVVIARTPDTVSNGVNYANYMLVVSLTGTTRTFSRTSLGQIATYIGAEGGATYPSGETADEPATVCNENTQNTIRGGFGASCADMAPFTGAAALETGKPATLSFVSMLDSGVSDDRYLWRIGAPTAGLNQMTVNMGMVQPGATPGIYFANALPRSAGITGVTGGISLDAGTPPASGISGVSGGIAITGGSLPNAITGVIGGIDMAGGPINTRSGVISTDGGGIVTSGGDIQTATGNIVANNGDFTGELKAGSFIYRGTPSDKRLKTDIKKLENALPNLLQINGMSYRVKTEQKKTIGVIAQEVEVVYPELVEDLGGKKIVNYNGLIGVLIEAVHELKSENDHLKKRIETLEQAR